MEPAQQVNKQMSGKLAVSCEESGNLASMGKRKNSSPFMPKTRTSSLAARIFVINGKYCKIPSQAASERGSSRIMSFSELCRENEVTAKLSKDKMAALETDIFKPLDSCEILLDRVKASDYKGKTVTSIHELSSI